jgi:hypothetical protein
MKKGPSEMTQLQADKSMVTIDSDTGTITIDLVAYGPIRIVMTVDGDIEVEGRSILGTAHWTNFGADIAKRT